MVSDARTPDELLPNVSAGSIERQDPAASGHPAGRGKFVAVLGPDAAQDYSHRR